MIVSLLPVRESFYSMFCEIEFSFFHILVALSWPLGEKKITNVIRFT